MGRPRAAAQASHSAGVPCAERRGEGAALEVRQAELLAQARLEVGLDRGDRHPPAERLVEAVGRQAAAHRAVGAGQPVHPGAGERLGGIREGDLGVALPAAPLAPEQQGQDRRDGPLGAADVGHQRARQRRRGQQAQVGQVGEVVARHLLARARVADDRDLHQARVALADLRPAEPEARERGRAAGGDEHVGALQVAVERGAVAGVLQVQPQHGLAGGEDAVPARRAGLEHVARGRLHLDHLGAHAGQARGGGGRGQVDAEVDDGQPVEGAGRGAHGG